MCYIGQEHGNNTCKEYLKIIGSDMRVEKGSLDCMSQQLRKVGMKAM